MKKQSKRDPLLPAGGDVDLDLLKLSAPCFHCEMSCSNDVSNYASFCLSMFVPVFLQILWRMHRHYWGSEKLCFVFTGKLFPSLHESADFPRGEASFITHLD